MRNSNTLAWPVISSSTNGVVMKHNYTLGPAVYEESSEYKPYGRKAIEGRLDRDITDI